MPPKAKPVELAPKAGLAGVPKVVAVVAAAEPKVKGAGAVLEAGVDVEPLTPKAGGFGGAAEEPKVGCTAGASNADFPKVKVDCVVEVAAAVEAVGAMAKPPNEAVVVFWLGAFWPGAAWPKVNIFWLAAWGLGCAAPNVKEPWLAVVVAAAGAPAGVAVLTVVGAPKKNVLSVL